MAELNVVVRYRSATARVLFVLMCLLLPLWAVASPFILLQFIYVVLADPSVCPLSTVVSTVLAQLAFTFASAAALALAEDNRIHITRDGITFPLFLSSRLGFRRHRRWEELSTAGLVGAELDNRQRRLGIMLGFISGNSIPLKLSDFNQEQQEQLFMAIELWAPQCQRSLELSSYQKDVHDREHLIGNAGYTRIWEDELSRRFSATSFVPLEPAAKLLSGKIEIVRQLAFGGLSALYLAQMNGRDLVVVKEAVIPTDACPELRRQAEKQLDREAELLAGLNHPRIARVLDHLVEDARHYLVLEYIPGQDLRQYVKQNGALPEAKALEWALSIADLLVYLHGGEKPVIHRDLTPENLILTNEQEIVLIDFGAANQFVGTATGTIVGKQAYIPPEQLRGKAAVQSDFYAFGGTLYFLLTGSDPRALSVNHPKELVDNLSKETDALVARCLSFEPANRFASAEDLRRELKNIIAPTLTISGRT